MWITGGYTVAIFVGVGFMAIEGLGPGINIALGLGVTLTIFLLAAIASFVARANSAQTVKEWFDVWSLAGTRNLRRTFMVRSLLCVALH
jgi:hypothetical protein